MASKLGRNGCVFCEIKVWSLRYTSHFTSYVTSCYHYDDVIMGAIASLIASLTIATVYSDADRRKHQSSASLAFVWGIHRGPGNSPHKWPVTRKMFPCDDVTMISNGVIWNHVCSCRCLSIYCLHNLLARQRHYFRICPPPRSKRPQYTRGQLIIITIFWSRLNFERSLIKWFPVVNLTPGGIWEKIYPAPDWQGIEPPSKT